MAEIDQFREQIPILPYSSYEPFTDRIAQGENNLSQPIQLSDLDQWLTGKKKLIPTTRRSQNSFRRATLTSIALSEALHGRSYNLANC